jgi:hypothetical protein
MLLGIVVYLPSGKQFWAPGPEKLNRATTVA